MDFFIYQQTTKLKPYGIIINRNQNLPFQTSLHQFFKNCYGFDKYDMPYLDSPQNTTNPFVFLFRQPSMKMQHLMQKFPHLPEIIFRKLDLESLFKCREVAKLWQDIIDERNYPWLCIVNIPAVMKYGNTYLHLAAETGQMQAFKTAFSEEEDKNVKDVFGETPFHIACANGRFEIVQLLLEKAQIWKNNQGRNNRLLAGKTATSSALRRCRRRNTSHTGYLIAKRAKYFVWCCTPLWIN